MPSARLFRLATTTFLRMRFILLPRHRKETYNEVDTDHSLETMPALRADGAKGNRPSQEQQRHIPSQRVQGEGHRQVGPQELQRMDLAGTGLGRSCLGAVGYKVFERGRVAAVPCVLGLC